MKIRIKTSDIISITDIIAGKPNKELENITLIAKNQFKCKNVQIINENTEFDFETGEDAVKFGQYLKNDKKIMSYIISS